MNALQVVEKFQALAHLKLAAEKGIQFTEK